MFHPYVCVYVSINSLMLDSICVFMYIADVHVYMYNLVCLRESVCVYACVCVCLCVYVWVCVWESGWLLLWVHKRIIISVSGISFFSVNINNIVPTKYDIVFYQLELSVFSDTIILKLPVYCG